MDATVIQAKKKAVSELTAVMNTETRAGRVESAFAVNAKIKELNEEIQMLSEESGSKKGADVIVGKWRMHNGVQFVFERNNSFSASGGNFKWDGKWRKDGNKLIVDSTVVVDTYDLPPQKEVKGARSVWSLKGRNSKGEPIFMERDE